MATAAEAVYINFAGTFPDTLGINATGPSATDGTEFIAAMINNYLFGPQQALLDHAGLNPDGITEAAGTAQTIEAIQKGFAAGPGMGVVWWLNDDPATTGHRVLLLNGQVITIASYVDLVDATYVGDGNNGTASAFYKTSDGAGTIRDTAGPFFVLPDLRGYALRGLDTAASVDPDGASRDVGSVQLDAMQKITGNMTIRRLDTGIEPIINFAGAITSGPDGTGSETITRSGTVQNRQTINFDNSDSISPNPAKTNDIESRMANVATRLGIAF